MSTPTIQTIFSSLFSLKGVGEALQSRLQKFMGTQLLDLYFHLPFRFEHRIYLEKLQDYQPETLATFTVKVLSHDKPFRSKQPYKVLCEGVGGFVYIIFFNMPTQYILQQLPVGSTRLISGKLECLMGSWQMIHPDHIGDIKSKDTWTGFHPVYNLPHGISGKIFHRIVTEALQKIPSLPEWISPAVLHQQGWDTWDKSIQKAHSPIVEEDLSPLNPIRQRLAFDEFFAEQISFALVRLHYKQSPGLMMKPTGLLTGQMELPFELTMGQQKAIQDILQDLQSGAQMLRLLQGDVGSGKTVVALYCLLVAIEAGYQGVLLAPTEILAQQLYENIKKYAARIPHTLLVGGALTIEKKQIIQNIADGSVKIIVGTHALLEDNIIFQNLGMIVVDEQHRFGVEQRLRLTRKGIFPHILVMSATPIPRTLCLTAYGELQVTNLLEKPAYRQPITTSTLPLKRIEEVYKALSRIIEKSEKIYWVCPLIEESEVLNLGHVMERFQTLQHLFGDKVGLLHGRMKNEEKNTAMSAFKNGPLQILVATTVVEVGVDVPDATVMVIEHGERFGLAQLHQLRGRVGRGNKPSSCLLLYGDHLSETGKKRLSIIKEYTDGFKIAEADLKLRGAGDMLGTRQSGLPLYRLADLFLHQDLLELAQIEANTLLTKDPQLTSDQGQAVRILLKMFHKEQCMQYLLAG